MKPTKGRKKLGSPQFKLQDWIDQERPGMYTLLPKVLCYRAFPPFPERNRHLKEPSMQEVSG